MLDEDRRLQSTTGREVSSLHLISQSEYKSMLNADREKEIKNLEDLTLVAVLKRVRRKEDTSPRRRRKDPRLGSEYFSLWEKRKRENRCSLLNRG